jgi:hypothetical protein
MSAKTLLLDTVARSIPSEAELQIEIGKKLRELAVLRRLKRLAREIAEARHGKTEQRKGAANDR